MNNNNINTDKKEPSKFNGTMNEAAGSIKETAGKVLNNGKMQGEGFSQKYEGKSEKTMSDIKEKVKAGVHVAGDALERVGEKLSEKGFDRAGAAVRKAGDKLEHSAD